MQISLRYQSTKQHFFLFVKKYYNTNQVKIVTVFFLLLNMKLLHYINFRELLPHYPKYLIIQVLFNVLSHNKIQVIKWRLLVVSWYIKYSFSKAPQLFQQFFYSLQTIK
jgi:hypothetical protein